ncbi:hypothetical protein CRG98_040872 [Punica granatum]|uniref:Uncharacterized protein n=1 Tax=Punica granatum TaxID=22663 RepID=A0A2I0I439_PUNGR|nr:hypothetical protein CRG98_040872 [Punica granatum]
MESPRHSCLKLELPNTIEPDQIEPIFIEATWYDTHFDLSIMNGLNSWVCTGHISSYSPVRLTLIMNPENFHLHVSTLCGFAFWVLQHRRKK